MFLSKTQVPILAQKLIVEVALRSGSPTSESPSPYRGFYSHLQTQLRNFKRSTSEFDGSIYEILNEQEDYNADKQCPTFEYYTREEYNDETKPPMYSPAKGEEPDYARRLEDIDSTWIEAYLTNAIWGAINNASQSIREYNKRHPMARMMQDEEDDTLVSEADLSLEHENDYSTEEIAKAKEKIPYLLRRLHDKSKQLRVHVISLIIAYEKAKGFIALQNRASKSRKKEVAPRHLLQNKVYTMNLDGTIGYMFGADANNREETFKEARKWICHYQGYHDDYYTDMIELLHYYDVMGIDITKEDPYDYQEDFISQLTVIYITSNRDYVMRKRTGYHREVFEYLKCLPLEYFENNVIEETDDFEIVDNTMHIFNDSVFIDNEEKSRLENLTPAERDKLEKDKCVFVAYYNLTFGTNIDTTNMITQDGFLFRDTETPLFFDLGAIIEPDDEEYSNLALLHESGILIRLSKTHFTQYIDIETVTDVLSEYRNKSALGRVTIPTRYWIEVSI